MCSAVRVRVLPLLKLTKGNLVGLSAEITNSCAWIEHFMVNILPTFSIHFSRVAAETHEICHHSALDMFLTVLKNSVSTCERCAANI